LPTDPVQHDVPPPLEDDVVTGAFEKRDPFPLLFAAAESEYATGGVGDDPRRPERGRAVTVLQK